MLFIHCDVVHPESGEVLAEYGEVYNAQSPRARRVLAVCAAYPEYYFTHQDGSGIAVELSP